MAHPCPEKNVNYRLGNVISSCLDMKLSEMRDSQNTLNLIRLVDFNSTFDYCFEIEVIAPDFLFMS